MVVKSQTTTGDGVYLFLSPCFSLVAFFWSLSFPLVSVSLFVSMSIPHSHYLFACLTFPTHTCLSIFLHFFLFHPGRTQVDSASLVSSSASEAYGFTPEKYLAEGITSFQSSYTGLAEDLLDPISKSQLGRDTPAWNRQWPLQALSPELSVGSGT